MIINKEEKKQLAKIKKAAMKAASRVYPVLPQKKRKTLFIEQ